MSNDPWRSVGPVAGFQKQGQVDWMQMGNSLFSTSSQVLQRFADAGIQPMTHQAGLAISTQFRLGETGNQRVRDAMSSLRPYYGFESLLWFGFGHQSFLTGLTERELGLNCAALCACLGETYGSARASQLLQALWKTNDFPEELEPSRRQFGVLVSSCSGLFLSTRFADILQRIAGPYKEDFNITDLGGSAASPDLAKAINAMFQVSRGVLKAIDIHGGRDIAFLGAIAYWLFDLSIWVQMDDGSTLFSNCLHPEEAVLTLHYADVNRRQSSLVQSSATTFVLRSVEDLITDDPYSAIIFRLNWESCLNEMFHTDVTDILGQAAVLGKVLGAVARIYEAIATCEVDVGELSRTHFINFQPRGYGKSFINSICALLPEIGSSRDFQEGAKHSLSQGVAENVTAIQALIGQLKTSCSCIICANQPGRNYSCNVAVVLFLRYLGDIMSHVDSDPSILPTQSGLVTAYDEQRNLWKLAQNAQYTQGRSYLGMVMGIPHARDSLEDIKRFHPRVRPFLLDYILDQVSWLFIGRDHHHSEFGERQMQRGKPQCTALSRAGVCIWLDALRSANVDPGSMSTVHVVPGQIICKDRSYASVWDLSSGFEVSYVDMPVVEFSTPGTLISLPLQSSRLDLRLQALATEREVEGTIGFVYQVKSRCPSRYLQPGILTEELLVSTARFPCSKDTSCSEDPSMPYYLRRAGWDFMDYGRHRKQENIRFEDDYAILLWTTSDPVSKLLAIEGCRKNSWYLTGAAKASSLVLIRSRQCMACLVRYLQDSRNALMWEKSTYAEPKCIGPCAVSSLPCFIHVI